MPATAWPLFYMFPLTRTSRHLKLLLKYIKINENACVGVANFGTQTWSEFTNFNLCRQYSENQNKSNKTLTTFMRHLKSYLFSQYWFRIECVWVWSHKRANIKFTKGLLLLLLLRCPSVCLMTVSDSEPGFQGQVQHLYRDKATAAGNHT